MVDCKYCNQTLENCECHIPNEVKHKGLHEMSKEMFGDSRPLKGEMSQHLEDYFESSAKKERKLLYTPKEDREQLNEGRATFEPDILMEGMPLWIIAIVLMAMSMFVLTSCDKQHEQGRLSYQTDSLEALPMLVKVNGVVTDSITKIGNLDCNNTDEWVLLIVGGRYDITVYNDDGLYYQTTIRMGENECRLLEL